MLEKSQSVVITLPSVIDPLENGLSHQQTVNQQFTNQNVINVLSMVVSLIVFHRNMVNQQPCVTCNVPMALNQFTQTEPISNVTMQLEVLHHNHVVVKQLNSHQNHQHAEHHWWMMEDGIVINKISMNHIQNAIDLIILIICEDDERPKESLGFSKKNSQFRARLKIPTVKCVTRLPLDGVNKVLSHRI